MQQAHDLAVLYEMGAAIFAQRDEEVILSLLARGLSDAVGAVGACVATLDKTRRVAGRAAQHGTLPPGTPPVFELAPEVVEQVLGKLQAQVTRLGDLSVLHLPLALGQQVLGIIQVYAAGPPQVFSEKHVAICRALANQTAVAFLHAQLYQRTAVERSRLRAILEASRDGIILVSSEAAILDLNGMACRLLRLAGEPEDWLDCRPLDMLHALRRSAPNSVRAVLGELRAARRRSQTLGRGELEIDGATPTFVRYVVYPVRAVSLQVSGWLVLLHDITEERTLARARDDLTHMLVHDLRSPLTAVLSAVNMLSSGLLGEVPDDQYAMLNIIRRNGERLGEMVNAILDIARLETGQLQLALEPLDLAALVSDVLEGLYPAAQERQLQLASQLAPGLPQVKADRHIVERVLGNLLNNALKFTPPGGQVTLSARVEGSQVVLSVADSGPGIEPDLRSKLFQKFSTGRHEKRGSGLGLAFCKQAVEAHGGTIWVSAAQPDQQQPGSVFSFTLPIARQP